MKIVRGAQVVSRETPYNSLRELLDFAVSRYPNQPAYVYRSSDKETKGQSVEKSYAELRDDIRNYSASLTQVLKLELYNSEKVHIAVIGSNSYNWVIAHNATMFGLGVSVPLDKQLAQSEAVRLCERGRVSILAFDYSHREIAYQLSETNAVKHADSLNVGEKVADLPPMKAFVLLDKPEKIEEVRSEISKYTGESVLVCTMDEAIAQGKTLPQEFIEEVATVPEDLDAMAAIYFTSGTTSESKGVMLSQNNIVGNIKQGLRTLSLKAGGRSLSVLPLHHTFESTIDYCFWGMGITICINDSLRNMMKNFQDWKITIMLTVPLMLRTIQRQIMKKLRQSGKLVQFNFGRKLARFLLKLGIDKRRAIFRQVHESLGGHLDWLVSGAASLSKEVKEFYTDLGFVNLEGYGLTEASPILAATRPDLNILGSVGPPICDVTIAINSERGDSPDTAGEILVKGANVMLGYYENPEATEAAFENGWLKTGDVGYFDEHGCIHVTGRVKSCIVLSNGKNVFPEEIEAFFVDVPGIKEVVIWGDKTQRGAVDLAARFQIDKENLPEEIAEDDAAIGMWLKEIVHQVNQKMTEYKIIKQYIWDESDMIMTTTLKVKREKEIERIGKYLAQQGVSLRDIKGQRVYLPETVGVSATR